MAYDCQAGQYWDSLIRRCLDCHMKCQRPDTISKCTNFCKSAECKAMPGHYYDMLLKKCVNCSAVCGRHPEECSAHCQASLPSVTPENLRVDVSPHMPFSTVQTGLEEPGLLLYSLLALSIVLLFSSLCLALIVLLRGARANATKIRLKEGNHKQERTILYDQEVGQPRQCAQDFATHSSCPTDREPSDDSSPTETCVCVHCFPDLKALNQSNDKPLRAAFTFYPHPVLHKVQIQKGGPIPTEGNSHNPGLEVQEGPTVG